MSVNSHINFDIFARDHASPVFNKFGKEVQRTDKHTRGMTSGVKTLAKGFLAFEAVQKATDFVKESIIAGREQQKTEAQTAAVIKSTSGAAHVSAKEFEELAKQISLKTGIDNDQIQASENMLATFTNIRNGVGKNNDIFTQASKVSTDLAVAMKLGPAKAALQVGKALNDPIKGLSRLQRIGVTFTDQQKKQVTQMMKVGDTAGAQKVILAELTKEFGGSAAAQATAGDKFRNNLHLLQEQIGTALIPVLDKMSIYGSKAIAWLQKNPAAMKAILIGIGAIAVAFGAVIIAAYAIPIAIGVLVGGLVYAYKKFKWFHDGVNTAAKGIGEAFRFLWNNLMEPIFKLIIRSIGIQLIAWGKLMSALGHVPGFGWAKKAGAAMQDAGHKALGLANDLHKIPKNVNPKVDMDTRSFSASLRYVYASMRKIGALSASAKVSLHASDYPPPRAHGGWANGVTLVGERGPELVDLPGGSHVYTNRQSAAMLGSGGSADFGTVTVVVVSDDGRELQRKLLKLKRDRGRNAQLGLA